MLGNGGSHLRDVIRQSPVNKGMVVTQSYIQAYFIDKLFVLKKKKLFIWLCRVLVAACGVFSCGMRALNCSMWDLVP